MNKLIKVFMFILIIESCAAQETPLKIAETGEDKDLSVGWTQISVKTELGDTISIVSNPKSGIIEKFLISGKRNIIIDSSITSPIRYPDFRTLRDVWYLSSLEGLSMLRFEFMALYGEKKERVGQFKAYILLDEKTPKLIVKEFNTETRAWNVVKN